MSFFSQYCDIHPIREVLKLEKKKTDWIVGRCALLTKEICNTHETWKPWSVPWWYIVSHFADRTGCPPHWVRWLISARRHLLLGNKLPGRHWSDQNIVYAALTCFFPFRPLLFIIFKAPHTPRCCTENAYCWGTNWSRISHISNKRTWQVPFTSQ